MLAFQTQERAPHIEGFGDWDIILVTHRGTDRNAVALTSSGAIVELSDKGQPIVITARGHDCPGKPLIISIDDHKAVLLGEGGRRHVSRVIDQMLSGKRAVLAYFEKPCEESQRLELSLEGFTETLETARRLPDKQMRALEEQVLAVKAELARKEAEARLTESPSEALLLAAREGHVVHVIASLGEGADVNVRTESNGYTPLLWASARGHTEAVRLLLDAGADVNLQASDGQTALMRAADNGHADIVQLLLDAGADVNVETERGITALLLAEGKNRQAVVELLKKAGASQ